MLSAGQMGEGHRPEALKFIRGRGKGKGVLWERRDLRQDREMLKNWLLLLRGVFAKVRDRLKVLGEDVSDLDAIGAELIVKTALVARSFVASKPPIAATSFLAMEHPKLAFYRRTL
jgi:hypothetical protein